MKNKTKELRLTLIINPAFKEQLELIKKEIKKLNKIKPFLDVFTDK